MSSLAEFPEVIGFFSYSREDDEAFAGSLSALGDGIQRELGAQLGRSKKTFRLWQDQEAIAPGTLWETEIKAAVEQSLFFIPIVPPRAVYSEYCQFEFKAFLSRERTLGRSDLVFPILYIGVPALENEAQWRAHPVLSIIGQRQYVDWRPFRHHDVHTTAVRAAIERCCQKIVEALQRPWLSPEERQAQAEAAEQQRIEEERLRQEEADARRRAEETNDGRGQKPRPSGSQKKSDEGRSKQHASRRNKSSGSKKRRKLCNGSRRSEGIAKLRRNDELRRSRRLQSPRLLIPLPPLICFCKPILKATW